jgi:hypothetical protein
LTTRDGAVTIDVDAADGADALAAPADEPQLQPLTPEELKTQWENVLALYTVSHRLIIGDDDTSSPRTPLTCVDLRRLPLRMRGPFAAAAGDFSDEESESDDSDDDGVAGAPLVTSPSVTAGDGAGDAAAGAAGAGAGAGVGRGRRRRVVDGVVGRVITHADAHRAGSMHMRVGALTVMRWGRIVRCRGGFNSDALLFPVGYCAHRVYWGPQRQYQRSVYVCEVLPRAVNATTPEQLEAVTVHAVGKRGRQQAVDAAVVPVFVITNLDDPSLRVEGVTHEGAVRTDVVLAVCMSLMLLLTVLRRRLRCVVQLRGRVCGRCWRAVASSITGLRSRTRPRTSARGPRRRSCRTRSSALGCLRCEPRWRHCPTPPRQ